MKNYICCWDPCCCCWRWQVQNCNNCCGQISALGTSVYGAINSVIKLPFGAPTKSTCGTFTHAVNTPEFRINETGDYKIFYKVSASNPAIDPSLPIDMYVDLVSANQGVLDTSHFTMQNQMIQKTINVHLTAGDIVYLQGRQNTVSEMLFDNLSISISKICR